MTFYLLIFLDRVAYIFPILFYYNHQKFSFWRVQILDCYFRAPTDFLLKHYHTINCSEFSWSVFCICKNRLTSFNFSTISCIALAFFTVLTFAWVIQKPSRLNYYPPSKHQGSITNYTSSHCVLYCQPFTGKKPASLKNILNELSNLDPA